MSGRQHDVKHRHRLVRAVLLVSVLAASVFVWNGGIPAEHADHEGRFNVATLTSSATVRHAPTALPAARMFAIVAAQVTVAVAVFALGLALVAAEEARRLRHGERWHQRRGPPVTA